MARSAEDPVSYTGPGLGNDLSALPGVTMLQTVAQLPRGLLELQGFTNMHKVRLLEGIDGRLCHPGMLLTDSGTMANI